MTQVILSLLIFNLNKDSLHFLTDFDVIRILLGTVFRTPELVHFDQITIIGVDPTPWFGFTGCSCTRYVPIHWMDLFFRVTETGRFFRGLVVSVRKLRQVQER